MAKIYIVVADNGEAWDDHSWWNVAAFNSEEAAHDYIERFSDIIKPKLSRLEELGNLRKDLSAEELDEWRHLNENYGRYRWFENGYFTIEELDILG